MRHLKSILLALAVAFLAGCSGEPGGKAGDPKAAVDPDQTFQWKMVSTWNDASLSGVYEQRFVELVDKLSNGRLKITRYAQGKLVSPTEVLDTVSKGSPDSVKKRLNNIGLQLDALKIQIDAHQRQKPSGGR